MSSGWDSAAAEQGRQEAEGRGGGVWEGGWPGGSCDISRAPPGPAGPAALSTNPPSLPPFSSGLHLSSGDRPAPREFPASWDRTPIRNAEDLEFVHHANLQPTSRLKEVRGRGAQGFRGRQELQLVGVALHFHGLSSFSFYVL